MAQTWNDTTLPWQNEALPFKSLDHPWNDPAIPWKAAPNAHPFDNLLLRNGSSFSLLRNATDFLLLGH